MGNVSKLFHGIVVVGAALGCSGQNEPSLDETPGGGNGGLGSGGSAGGGAGGASSGAEGGTTAAGGGLANPSDCAYPEQFVCTDLELWRRCSVVWSADCGTLAASMNCECDPSAPRGPEDCSATQEFTCSNTAYDNHLLACYCDPDAALGPDACEAPQQYHCRFSDPERECACDPEAPLTADDCETDNDFECRSYEPPTDCQCVWTIILPK